MERVRKLLENKEKPIKWVFYGDSITHGARHTAGWRDYPQLFAERVRFEMGRVQDIIINTAISGDNTAGLLKYFDWRVKQFAPDVVFIMIGMNDCSEATTINEEQFYNNLIELDTQISDFGGQTVLQTTCPILPKGAPEREPHFDGYMEMIRKAAAERKLPLIDHTKIWRAQYAAQHYFWMNNAFHPNEKGHRAFAFEIFKALEIFNPEESATCRLFVA